tara:strand:- start:1448 stop:2080 length:633 start_codon:yes stop_codon:yes gene_type:complete
MSDRWRLWTRNVVDRYKDWPTDSIKQDMRNRANPFAVCMEHWRGDFNISTLIRNANAFNARKVLYLGKRRIDRRGTVGAHHYIDFLHLAGGISELVNLKKDYTIVGVENNVASTSKLHEFDWLSIEKPPLMLFGEEGVGLTQEALEIVDYCVEIPQYGSVRSLNVGTTSGILMYDFVQALESSKDFHRWQKELHGGTENAQNVSCQQALL